MNLAFSQEDLDFKEEVRVFLKSEYPSKIREKQEKGLPLERDDVIKVKSCEIIQKYLPVDLERLTQKGEKPPRT